MEGMTRSFKTTVGIQRSVAQQDHDMSTAPKTVRQSGMCLWPAALIVWGPGSAPGQHAHHCAQLSVALTGTLRVRKAPLAPWRRCHAVVVKPDAEHDVDASGAFVVMALIGAGGLLDAVTAHARSAMRMVPSDEATTWQRALGDPRTLDADRVTRWVSSTLMQNRVPTRVDARVQRVIGTLRRHPLDTRTTALVELARVAGLSPSRFAHVFTESIGVPVRPYVRWLRLQRAARELVFGRSVTQAAHIAGFSDAAHLTRTFRRTLGISPRMLMQRHAAAASG
jgi:AraC-like DNA-binding protein